MTPQFFIQKWRRATLTERAATQSHFNDLCALLGEPTPTDADPDRLKPEQTTAAVTAQAAEIFAQLAQRLRERGHDPHRVAHFVTRLLFCMFAEGIGLLPRELFTRLLATALPQPERFVGMAHSLFAAMSVGGVFGVEVIAWFSGGLFDDPDAIPLDAEDLRIAHRAALLDWAAIEPAIFGTLFERGLDPDKRGQLGAHYTDRASIERLIAPVIREPLWAEWRGVKAAIATRLAKTAPKARQQAEQMLRAFLERLRTFRVLDPACGSGNFLYLALQTLKDLEHQVMLEAEQLGLQRGFPLVGPEAVSGIEINPYAAELARVTVWIGEIQWMLSRGYSLNDQPILKPLEQIFCRDALLNADGTEAEWPKADAIVGNPPFLGGSKILGLLGERYTSVLRTVYRGRVPGGADLVCYWFEKARALIERGKVQRAGLVATNSIRGGSNRKVLERILNTGVIFNAWSDEDWVNEGAAVRVSLICFGAAPTSLSEKEVGGDAMLDSRPVARINADLTADICGGALDLTRARSLVENAGLAFQGPEKNGAFDISGDLARQWLPLPNPHGRSNGEILKPRWNGLDLSRRPTDTWIIDFGTSLSEVQAALYEAPFGYIVQYVKPERDRNRDLNRKRSWWRFGRTGEDLRSVLANRPRYIATPHVAKHRLFVWLSTSVLPDKMLIVIARDDDTAFGILHSRFHELWALRLGTSLEDRPRYTPTTTFETFPFPEGLQPNIPASAYADDPRARAIADAARRLVELRANWLNPPEWVRRVPEVMPGYPDRLLPVDDRAAAELKKRTLTNLYNQRPTWLANAHRTLDEAVAAAYGWSADSGDEDILRRLLVLNRERASTRIT